MEVGGGETIEQTRARLNDKTEYAVLRGTCVVLFFLALWTICLYVFRVAHIDISCIYPNKPSTGDSGKRTPLSQPFCSYRKVATLASSVLALFAGSALIWSKILGQPAAHSPLLFFPLLGILLLYPHVNTHFYREWVHFVAHILLLVLWPGNEIQFIEILLGDILTSLSKVFFEIGLTSAAFCFTYASTQSLLPNLLPTSLATIPFILRIRQCLVQYHTASSDKGRLLISLNILKYCSSLPGLWLPLLLSAHYTNAHIQRVLLYVLLLNSIYSFLWDVIMDWGLGRCRARHCGLRSTLLFRTKWQYYGVIVTDLILRFVWVLKYVGIQGRISYDNFMWLIEMLEVSRRAMWSVYRIEWEVLSKTQPGDGENRERLLSLKEVGVS